MPAAPRHPQNHGAHPLARARFVTVADLHEVVPGVTFVSVFVDDDARKKPAGFGGAQGVDVAAKLRSTAGLAHKHESEKVALTEALVQVVDVDVGKQGVAIGVRSFEKRVGMTAFVKRVANIRGSTIIAWRQPRRRQQLQLAVALGRCEGEQVRTGRARRPKRPPRRRPRQTSTQAHGDTADLGTQAALSCHGKHTSSAPQGRSASHKVWQRKVPKAGAAWSAHTGSTSGWACKQRWRQSEPTFLAVSTGWAQAVAQPASRAPYMVPQYTLCSRGSQFPATSHEYGALQHNSRSSVASAVDGDVVWTVGLGAAANAMVGASAVAGQSMFRSCCWSAQEKRAATSALPAFLLALLMVFLILAALYEDLALPLGVLLTVPFALLGALLAVLVRGMPNDIYFQIGLVTLIGLAAKNAILIVEFAETARRAGRSAAEAAVEAARKRIRPLVMTSLAFVLGVVPLAFASGAGAAARQSMGTGVLGGMLFDTFVATLFIPWFFHLLSGRKKPAVVQP